MCRWSHHCLRFGQSRQHGSNTQTPDQDTVQFQAAETSKYHVYAGYTRPNLY
jgi:hypothetical protein